MLNRVQTRSLMHPRKYSSQRGVADVRTTEELRTEIQNLMNLEGDPDYLDLGAALLSQCGSGKSQNLVADECLAALSSCGSIRHTDLAMGLLSAMEFEGINPGEAHYKEAIRACGRKWKQALSVRPPTKF